MPPTVPSSVPDETSPSSPLSRGELERYRRAFAEDGYVIIENVVSPGKLSELHARLLDAFGQAKLSGQLFTGGGLVSGHLNCFPGEVSRFIHNALRERGVLDLIRSILPGATRAPNVGCNFNLPRSVVQHYHVDREFTREFMIANVSTVDTDLSNGAIEVVPGTHKRFYKFWRFVAEGCARSARRLPMRKGDVLLRTSNLWHRGMPNRTAMVRPMIALTWEDGGSEHEDPFRLEGGRIVFRPNWFRTNLLGRLRERTFVAAPFTYDAYRFVRSLVSDKGYAP